MVQLDQARILQPVFGCYSVPVFWFNSDAALVTTPVLEEYKPK